MVSLLEGALKREIAKAFRGQLSKCKLRVAGTASLDAKGDAVEGSPTIYYFDGMRENIDLSWAARAGVEATDVRLLFILGSLPRGVTPKKGNQVFVGKPFYRWHEVRQILTIDPAGASCQALAFEVAAPE